MLNKSTARTELRNISMNSRNLARTSQLCRLRDAEARVWYIADSDLPGLNLESESLDELYDKLFHGIKELTGEPKVEFELVVLGRRWSALV